MSSISTFSIHYLQVFVAAVVIAGLPSVLAAQTVVFADEALGSKPKGFEYALTGGGPAPSWEIVADSTAQGGKALAQTGTDTIDYRFPLAVYTAATLSNVEVTAHFRPVAGSVDQAGGIVVRFADPNNYNVVRANALEDNIRFYRVINGNRQQLGGANVKVKSGEWRTLTLRADGETFTVTSDGKELFTVRDKTFAKPGRAGLWTKADSVTHFDRIEIKALP
jgi:hypothetical protein